jgi:hypothetical protein
LTALEVSRYSRTSLRKTTTKTSGTSQNKGSSGKFRQRKGKPVGRKNEEPSLSWIWNQRLPVSSDEV